MSNSFSVHPDHLAINIQDLEKSLHFYGEILELPKLPDVDMGDHHLYYFDLGNGLRLELIKYVDDFGETHPRISPSFNSSFSLLFFSFFSSILFSLLLFISFSSILFSLLNLLSFIIELFEYNIPINSL